METPRITTIDLNFSGLPNGIASFLIEHNSGPILVETGPHSTLPTLEAALLEYGHKLSDIKHVFISHIHLDHAGAAWCFAELGAKIYLHPRGFRHMHDPSRLLSSAQRIYGDDMDRLWGTLKPIDEKQLQIVDHLEEVNIDGLTFKAHHTPGHAQHHIAWQLGKNLFTGDVAGVCVHNGPVIPPCPPPDIDKEAWLDSINWISTLSDIDTYYLTHFGSVTDVASHMEKLKQALEDYTSFAKPYAEAKKSAEEILPDFRKFVQEYLMSHGLDTEDAMAYEAANPSDMSATGLLRYWTKKLELK